MRLLYLGCGLLMRQRQQSECPEGVQSYLLLGAVSRFRDEVNAIHKVIYDGKLPQNVNIESKCMKKDENPSDAVNNVLGFLENHVQPCLDMIDKYIDDMLQESNKFHQSFMEIVNNLNSVNDVR